MADGDADDRRFMQAARRLSRRNVGLTAENPSVGALIVQGRGSTARIVGHGVTAAGGRPHAERVALAEAGEAARGGTAYVTLEPCAHHGRTGPCAEALVAAGIGRVVIGADDPDPRVDGKGAAILRDAGVEIRRLPAEPGSERAFEGFLSRIRTGRPFVTLKMAVSDDGAVGRLGSERVSISGPIANRQVHLMRAASDAIMIGVGTAMADDPMLTCRLPGLAGRSPVRIVVDPQLRLSPDSRLARTAANVPTLLATIEDPVSEKADRMRRAGCDFLSLGGYEATELEKLLQSLPERGVHNLMVEGGPALANSLLWADLVDRIVVIRSPVTIGALGIAAPAELVRPSRFRLARRERFGTDVWSEWERNEPCSPGS